MLTKKQVEYRLKLWIWIIDNIQPNNTYDLMIFCNNDKLKKQIVTEHIKSMMTDRVDFANGFELLFTEDMNGILKRQLSFKEIKKIQSLFT